MSHLQARTGGPVQQPGDGPDGVADIDRCHVSTGGELARDQLIAVSNGSCHRHGGFDLELPFHIDDVVPEKRGPVGVRS